MALRDLSTAVPEHERTEATTRAPSPGWAPARRWSGPAPSRSFAGGGGMLGGIGGTLLGSFAAAFAGSMVARSLFSSSAANTTPPRVTMMLRELRATRQ